MGISYSSCMRLGFGLTAEALDKPFTEVLAVATVLEEPRFCPKTGKKLAPVVKEVPAKTQLVYKGQIVEDYPGEAGSLADTIAKDLGCEVDYYGSWPSGEMYYAFYIPVKMDDPPVEDYKCEIAGSMDYEDLVSKADELNSLGKKLSALGLDPGKPKVLSVWDIS